METLPLGLRPERLAWRDASHHPSEKLWMAFPAPVTFSWQMG